MKFKEIKPVLLELWFSFYEWRPSSFVHSDFKLDNTSLVVNESLWVFFLYGIPCGVTLVETEYLDVAEGHADQSRWVSAHITGI